MRYRLYHLHDHRLTDMDEVEAADDSEATSLAKAQSGPGVIEVWCGSRRVRTVSPMPLPSD